MAMDEKGLGKRLQLARQAAGLTQQALCQKANLSYSTLTKIERGAIHSPSIFTIQSIAEALGVTLDTLLGVSAPARPVKQREQSKSGIRFVYFDINGCLVHFFQQGLTKLAHDTGQPTELVESAFWHHNDQVCRGEITMDEFNHSLAERLHVSSVDWQHYYLEAVEPIAEMHEVVTWASEHYGVGLLSNIMPGLIERLLESGLLPALPYDVIIDSSEVHAIKPEKKIFELAQKRAEQAPEEILLVDDSRVNVMAAEKLGWHVLWFDDYRAANAARSVQQTLSLI